MPDLKVNIFFIAFFQLPKTCEWRRSSLLASVYSFDAVPTIVTQLINTSLLHTEAFYGSSRLHAALQTGQYCEVVLHAESAQTTGGWS